MKSITQLYMFN